MGFIIANWWIWMTLTLGSFTYAIVNQIQRIIRLKRTTNVVDQEEFFQGCNKMIAAILIMLISAALLVVSVALPVGP